MTNKKVFAEAGLARSVFVEEVGQKVTETFEKDYFYMIARAMFWAGSFK